MPIRGPTPAVGGLSPVNLLLLEERSQSRGRRVAGGVVSVEGVSVAGGAICDHLPSRARGQSLVRTQGDDTLISDIR